METDRLLQRLKQYFTEPSTSIDWHFVRTSGALATLELRTEIGKYRFCWQFAMHAIRAGTVARDLLREQLLMPLVDLVRAYEHRVTELSFLLHRHEALVLEKFPRQMLPAELRPTVNDADLERSAVQKMSETEIVSPASLFKQDSFAERAFTHRLRRVERVVAVEREVKRARLAPASQQSASAAFDGGSPASAAVASSSSPPPPTQHEALPHKRSTPSETSKSRTTPTAAAAATSAPTTTIAALARTDSIEETADELERRHALEARLEHERAERAKQKAAVAKRGGKKGFL